MNIKYLDIDDFDKWDNFVLLHNKGTIFHKTNWLNNHFGEFKIVTVQEDSQLVGGFAYLISKKAGIKGIFRPPYTPYYHPLIKELSKDGNSEKEIEIMSLILKKISNYNISLLFDSQTKYLYPYQNMGYKITPKLNYILEPSLFLDSIAKRKKSTINRYSKAYNVGDLKILEDFNVQNVLALWIEFGKSKSMNTYKDFLFRVFDNASGFNNWGCLKIYTKEDKFLAAGLYLFDDKRLYNLIPIVNYQVLSNKEKNIGDYLYYNLSLIAERKALLLDYEGSEVPGVEKMYRRLGGRLELKHTGTKHNFMLRLIYKIKNLISK
ncbi:hypothetical protein [Aureibaculum luteum]|uniref:hypothetical protein n=1 Tax=Aureibaculum luteum TaxID=1548456 RepID=UPI000E4A2757|nr:hypothetical protein [Aureibaculum luteum]